MDHAYGHRLVTFLREGGVSFLACKDGLGEPQILRGAHVHEDLTASSFSSAHLVYRYLACLAVLSQ
jgi:hypothetical protein